MGNNLFGCSRMREEREPLIQEEKWGDPALAVPRGWGQGGAGCQVLCRAEAAGAGMGSAGASTCPGMWAWTHLDRLGRRVRTELSDFAVCIPWDLVHPAENFICTWEPGTVGAPTAPPGRRASTACVQQEKGSWGVTGRVCWWWPDPQQARAAGAGPATRSG